MMSTDPIYYLPEQLNKDKLTQALSGMVQNFVDGVIDGSIQHYGETVNLKIETKNIGPMAVVRAIYQIKIGDDGVWVDGAKVAVSTVATSVITGAIITALGVESLPAVAAIVIGATIGTAVAALWDYEFKDLPARLIDPLFGTEDTKIEYIKNGETVGGVLFPNLDLISEPGQIRLLLDHFNEDIRPGIQEGDTFSILKNDVKITEYKVAKGDLLEIAAANIGMSVEDFYGVDGAKFRDGTIGQNSDVVIRDGLTGFSVYHEQSALAMTLEVHGHEQSYSVPIKNITWSGILAGDNNAVGVHVYFGGAGNSNDLIDVLTSSDSVVFGGAGKDVIFGGTGNDTLYGDTSDKAAHTGADDELHGMLGVDHLYGGGGNDKLYGGLDGDTLDGGYGDDTLEGDEGEDVLSGGGDQDQLLGGAEKDTLYGGDGQDILCGDLKDGQDFASDILVGGNDADTYLLNSTGLFGEENPMEEMDIFVQGQRGNEELPLQLPVAKPVFRCADTIRDTGEGDEIGINGIGYLSHLMVTGTEVNGDYTFYQTNSHITLIEHGTDLYVADSVYSEFGSGVMNYWAGFDVIAIIENFFGGILAKASLNAVFGDSITGKYGINLTVAEEIFGNESDETIIGPNGPSIVMAFGGDDAVTTGDANDRIMGGFGNDTLYSNGGHDSIYGEEGNDLIDAGAGDDTVYGGDGDDIVVGGDGNDQLFGGDGKDELHGGAGDDVIDGGDGAEDWVSYWDASSVTVNLTDGIATGQGNDTISNIENVWGSDQNDSLTGDGHDNGLFGADGDDFIWGVDGFNTLDGGAGNDDIVSGHGNDAIEGGEGTDTVEYWWSTAGVTVSLADGTAHGDGDDTISGIENAVGSAFNDVLTGSEVGNQLYGDAGNDVLSGLAGNDYLNAGDGNDMLKGGVGDDNLVGGAGSDVFHFDPSFGHDTVEDFSVGDVIEFASSVFADFSHMLAAATEVDGNTVIAFDGDNSVTLQNVALASLSADEFRFAA